MLLFMARIPSLLTRFIFFVRSYLKCLANLERYLPKLKDLESVLRIRAVVELLERLGAALQRGRVELPGDVSARRRRRRRGLRGARAAQPRHLHAGSVARNGEPPEPWQFCQRMILCDTPISVKTLLTRWKFRKMCGKYRKYMEIS